jgi:CRISPR-associated endonuclease/helicase Cas3
MTFDELFEKATEIKEGPYPFQREFAEAQNLYQLVDVPTGLGKTAMVIVGWLWRRFHANGAIRKTTPRRLVYCLPMRVLVEQTAENAKKWVKNVREAGHLQNDVPIHILMGGEEQTDWALWPEREAILVGTQDMLLSRALNRGYAAGRARWPMEFGLLNNDCLWVFDEIQLMDTGLASSLQLDAWRRSLRLRSSRSDFPKQKSDHAARPCHSVWMSATMARHWLERAVDWLPRVEAAWNNRLQLTETERTDKELRSGQLFHNAKPLDQPPIAALEKPKTKDNRAVKADAERNQADYLKRLADFIGRRENHASLGLTLIILNTVDRAMKLFDLLRRQSSLDQVPVKLIHSRFRPYEREQWRDFLNRKDASRRILVSTQVVEAGVDLSASVLYTELAPWASLVQRFGRCARYPGESGQVIWLDLDLGSDRQPVDHWARPYERSELMLAQQKLQSLNDVGLRSLATIKAEIDAEQGGEQAGKIFPYEPRFVPRDKDLFDLFDTTPDLTGADIDISRYIRDGEELDVQVFWRELPDKEGPAKRDQPHRRELCPVPFHRFRELLPALRQAGRIWRRNYRKGWELIGSRDTEQVYPGQVYLLEKVCGGYSPELGWTGDTHHVNFDLPQPVEPTKASAQDEEEDSDDLSQINQWLSVLEHTRGVCQKLDEILDPTGLTDSEIIVLRLAARWHDRGKAHAAFVAKFKDDSMATADVQQKLGGQPAAKAPENEWRRDKVRPQPVNSPKEQRDYRRPGFRHELASALAILETLYAAQPTHEAFAWPDGLNKACFGTEAGGAPAAVSADDPLVQILATLSVDELDLLVYLVAAHHGKVRMSLCSSPDDDRVDVPDPCPNAKRQARGVRDGDTLTACQIPTADLSETGIVASEVILSLDPMELGLSQRYGASWRERMQFMLERLGPFRLAYLEALLRAADRRASMDEDVRGKEDQ